MRNKIANFLRSLAYKIDGVKVIDYRIYFSTVYMMGQYAQQAESSISHLKDQVDYLRSQVKNLREDPFGIMKEEEEDPEDLLN